MSRSPTISRSNTHSQNPDDKPIIPLSIAVQDYSYGKKGSKSLAARYALANEGEANFKIDEGQEYGEIWMGDHENGPSKSKATGTSLRTLIEQSPSTFLSEAVAKKFPGAGGNPQLPFLFKILSFDKALPLQAHPDKSLAEQLQKQEKEENDGKNEQFVDPNHKPEVAVTLSSTFESFVGFRPVAEIKTFIRDVEELRVMIGEDDSNIADKEDLYFDKHLKEVFGKLFKKDRETVDRCGKKLLEKIKEQGDKALGEIGERDQLGYVVQKVWNTYPGDAGLFAAVFFMNFIVLRKGEGVAVPADCIHAYLEGDVIECMANSDNMISCGFQGGMGPPDDSDLFVKMLLHNPGPSKHLLLPSHRFTKSRNSHTTKYEVPIPEFSILKTTLESSQEEFLSLDGPAIYIVTSGDVEITARQRPGAQAGARVTESGFVEGIGGGGSGDDDFRTSSGTPGPIEAVASEGGHVPLKRRGSECIGSSDEQREWLKEGMSVFVKPGYEIGFWNRGGGKAEIFGAYCEVDDESPSYEPSKGIFDTGISLQ